MGSLSPRRMLMMKPYEQWLVPDILVWINSLWTDNRFAPYVQRVQTNLNREGIVGRDLPGLSREDLVRFGIPDYGMCIRILEQIDGLANLPTPGSSLRSARSGRLRPFPNYLPQEEPGSSPASEAPSEELVEDDEYLEEEENDQFMEEENE